MMSPNSGERRRGTNFNVRIFALSCGTSTSPVVASRRVEQFAKIRKDDGTTPLAIHCADPGTGLPLEVHVHYAAK